jgi:hypothetical protein
MYCDVAQVEANFMGVCRLEIPKALVRRGQLVMFVNVGNKIKLRLLMSCGLLSISIIGIGWVGVCVCYSAKGVKDMETAAAVVVQEMVPDSFLPPLLRKVTCVHCAARAVSECCLSFFPFGGLFCPWFWLEDERYMVKLG